jgi:hypothetical protein
MQVLCLRLERRSADMNLGNTVSSTQVTPAPACIRPELKAMCPAYLGKNKEEVTMYKTVKVQPQSETVRPANFFVVLLFPNRKPGRVAMPYPFLPLRNPSSFMYNMLQYSHARVSFPQPRWVREMAANRTLRVCVSAGSSPMDSSTQCVCVCASATNGPIPCFPLSDRGRKCRHTKNARTGGR